MDGMLFPFDAFFFTKITDGKAKVWPWTELKKKQKGQLHLFQIDGC